MLQAVRSLINRTKVPVSMDVKLPGQPAPEGELVVSSSTWVFIEKWAMDEMERLRVLNDNGQYSLVPTSLLRGEIRFAKRLISLGRPQAFISPSQRRGILARGSETDEERDYSNYAGY